MMNRRELLKTLGGVGLVVVSAPAIGWSRTERRTFEPSRRLFPQGLASGDPGPDSIVLWTRVAPDLVEGDGADLELQLARDPGFSQLVLSRMVRARREDDFTVRVQVTGLSPETPYAYRFVYQGRVPDLTGRTRTAPAAGADVNVTFAVGSCQNYETGYFVAHRHLLESVERHEPHFVLWLGDFIYEMFFPGSGVRELAPPPSARGVDSKTSGLDAGRTVFAARTLEDYRYLYQRYLEDDDLRRLRARLPFVCIWDDHEFSNDSWQSYSTYTEEDQAEPARKIAANRAWFEYIPCDAPGARPSPEKGELRMTWPSASSDNATAIDSLRTYRSSRWGRRLTLLLTDCRSYRQAHPVPREIALRHSPNPRAMLPPDLVAEHDRKRPAADVAMLGSAQHAWLEKELEAGSARWQVIATSVPLTSIYMDFDLQKNALAEVPLVFTTDSWAGSPTERGRVIDLAARSSAPVVALSGDHHMSFVSQVRSPAGRFLTEIATAGISSTSLKRVMQQYVAKLEFGFMKAIDRLNTTLLHGSRAALGESQPAAKAGPNPELRYVDSDSYGYSLVDVGREDLHFRQVVFSSDDVKANVRADPVYTVVGRVRAQDRAIEVGLKGTPPADAVLRPSNAGFPA